MLAFAPLRSVYPPPRTLAPLPWEKSTKAKAPLKPLPPFQLLLSMSTPCWSPPAEWAFLAQPRVRVGVRGPAAGRSFCLSPSAFLALDEVRVGMAVRDAESAAPSIHWPQRRPHSASSSVSAFLWAWLRLALHQSCQPVDLGGQARALGIGVAVEVDDAEGIVEGVCELEGIPVAEHEGVLVSELENVPVELLDGVRVSELDGV